MKASFKMSLIGALLLCAAPVLGADPTTTRMGLDQIPDGSTGWGTKYRANNSIIDTKSAVQDKDNVFTGTNTFTGPVNITTGTLTSLTVGTLTATTGTITTLTSTTGTITNLTATTETVGAVTASTATVGRLTATTGTITALQVSSMTNTALTNTRIPVIGPGGLFQDFSNFTYNGTTTTVPNLSISSMTASGKATIANLEASIGRFKGEPWYDAKAYGATGDGTTNDTAALQTLLNLGGHIHIGAGLYITTAPLKYVSGSFIEGDGRGITTIKFQNSATIPNGHGVLEPVNFGVGGIEIYASSVTIAHLSVDANKTNVSGNFEGIILARVQSGTVFDCSATGASEAGFNVDTTIDTSTGPAPLSQIIGCYGYGNVDGTQIGKAIVTASYFYNNTNGIRSAGGGSTDGISYYSIVNGNAVFRNSSSGIIMEEQVGGAREPSIVSNNWVAKNGLGIAANLKGTQVIGNVVEYNGNGVATTNYGIRVSANDVSVKDNIIVSNNNEGIYIFNNRTNTDISGNVCYDDNASPVQAYCVIEDSWALGSNNTIHNNKGVGNVTGTIDPNFYLRPDYVVKDNDHDPDPDWDNLNDTWTYASATSLTVPAGATTRYSRGDRIRLVQSATTKYFLVVDVPGSTTLTITGGTDYTMTNNAITAPAFSKKTNPLGWPGWFNYTPSYTGFTGGVTTTLGKFNVVGNVVHLIIDCSGTSNSAAFTVTGPVTAATGSGVDFVVSVLNNSTWSTTPGVAQVVQASTTINIGINIGTIAGAAYAGFTNSGSKGVKGEFIYQM